MRGVVRILSLSEYRILHDGGFERGGLCRDQGIEKSEHPIEKMRRCAKIGLRKKEKSARDTLNVTECRG